MFYILSHSPNIYATCNVIQRKIDSKGDDGLQRFSCDVLQRPTDFTM